MRRWHCKALKHLGKPLENLLPDGEGGLWLSSILTGELLRLDCRTRRVVTVARGLGGLGGLARRGSALYMTVGNSFSSGLLGLANGRVMVLVNQGKPEPWAERLVMPNGLALLPDGSAVVTRDVCSLVGVKSGITSISSDGRTLNYFWSALLGTNGATVDPTGEWLYVSRTFTARAEVWRISTSDPGVSECVVDLGPGCLRLLDDLTFGVDGFLYIAADVGRIYRVNVETRAWSVIASGLPLFSAVKAGDGSGLDAGKLYATTLYGSVYEITPPAGDDDSG